MTRLTQARCGVGHVSGVSGVIGRKRKCQPSSPVPIPLPSIWSPRRVPRFSIFFSRLGGCGGLGGAGSAQWLLGPSGWGNSHWGGSLRSGGNNDVTSSGGVSPSDGCEVASSDKGGIPSKDACDWGIVAAGWRLGSMDSGGIPSEGGWSAGILSVGSCSCGSCGNGSILATSIHDTHGFISSRFIVSNVHKVGICKKAPVTRPGAGHSRYTWIRVDAPVSRSVGVQQFASE